jgi:hypothetical protein
VHSTQVASTVTIKAVEDFKLVLAEEFSEPTANGYLKLMKAAYNRGRRHGWVTSNPASAVKLHTGMRKESYSGSGGRTWTGLLVRCVFRWTRPVQDAAWR